MEVPAERVTVHFGDCPILVLAPHGPDDYLTDQMAKYITDKIDCFSVINWGWKKSSTINYAKSEANCNDLRHCHQDIVKDEFLNPIMRCAHKMHKLWNGFQVFILHGIGDQIRDIAPDLDAIIGVGNGDPPSITCGINAKHALLYNLNKNGINTYEGKGGGRYAGRDGNNLNQLFRRWYPGFRAESIQIEIIHELRADEAIAAITGILLADCFEKVMDSDDSVKPYHAPKI